MASETWSAILSGWPSVTLSEVNKKRSLNLTLLPLQGIQFGQPGTRTGSCWITAAGKTSPASDPLSRKARQHRQAMRLGMHRSMVIAEGCREQRLALNGDQGAPKGAICKLKRAGGFSPKQISLEPLSNNPVLSRHGWQAGFHPRSTSSQNIKIH